MSRHTISCAILSLSRELLVSGLLTVIKTGAIDSVNKRNQPLSSLNLSILVYKLLKARSDTILTSLASIIHEYCGIDSKSFDLSEYLIKQVCGDLFDNNNNNNHHHHQNNIDNDNIINSMGERDRLSTLHSCHITQGRHGRMIQTKSGVGRGHILIQESPLAAISKNNCTCHENVILNEYLTLAWTLGLLIHVDNHVDSMKSIGEMKYGQSFTSVPLQSIKKNRFQQFLSTFRSGLGSNILNSWDFETNSTSNYTGNQFWSLEVQTFMAVASTLCSIYTEYVYSQYDPIKSTELSTSFLFDSTIIFEILSRIPTNIHAVYDIVENHTSGTSDTVIEQNRIGYALFLDSSSVNHSCSPNSILRYNFSNQILSSSLSSSTVQSSSKHIDKLGLVSIEIVPLKSIGTGEEITISYGPLLGTHSYLSRQECLSTQFLFECKCVGCVDDLTKQSKSSQDNIRSFALDIENPNPSIEETILLCQDLISLRVDIEKINKQTTTLLISKPSKETLITYHDTNLMPMYTNLFTLKMRHFYINHDSFLGNDSNNNHINNNSDSSNSNRNSNTKAMTIEQINRLDPYRRKGIDKDLFTEFTGLYTTILDIQARVLSTAGRFLDAAIYVKEAIAIMIESGRYQIDDIAIGRERIKLAQLYFSGGDLICAKKTVARAVKDIQPIVHSQDPDLIDGLCMLQYLKKMKI